MGDHQVRMGAGHKRQKARQRQRQNVRRVKSDGRVRVRFLKERGPEGGGGSAEDKLCRAFHTRHGHWGTPMVHNNIMGLPSCSLARSLAHSQRPESKACGALPPLPSHKDTPFGEVGVTDGDERSCNPTPGP